MNIPLSIHGVLTDPQTESHIIILRDPQNTAVLPIWVGQTEGTAIRLALEGASPPRPQTHDLIKETLAHLGVGIEKVVINEVNDNVYFATLHLRSHRPMPDTSESSDSPQEWAIDARPSDAIAIALRIGAPIYAADSVLSDKGNDALGGWLDRTKPGPRQDL